VLNENARVVASRYSGFVQMLTSDVFLQITNCKTNIAFAGNIAVDLIDICQNVVKSLTVNENFFYEERTDIHGVQQIAYAFGKLGEDFGEQMLYLRLTHTVSDNVWYSAGFKITDNNSEETTYAAYKSEVYFRGISYDKINVFQRIRLTCFYTDIDPNTESEELVQISGNRYGLRPITTALDKYIFYACDFFTYNRVLQLLSHPIVYIDGIRKNTKADDLNKGERVVDSNFFEASFDANPTEEEFDFDFEIFQGFDVVAKIPTGNYSLADYYTATSESSVFKLTFNKPFTIASDISAKLYKDGALFGTFNASKFSIDGNDLNIDVSAFPVTESGVYNWTIPADKVNTNTESWSGLEFGEATFTILDGEYDSAEYGPEYLTT